MRSILLVLVTVVGTYAAAAGQNDVGDPSPGGLRGPGGINQGKGVQVKSQGKPGTTTTTWDCCKPACGWPSIAKKAGAKGSVRACAKNNSPLKDVNAQGVCQGGTAYSCADFQPKVVNETFAYGFAGHGAKSADVCCKCYQFTWTDGPAQGKSMIVQAVNSGGLPSPDDFDIYTPGGGVGNYADACSKQYGAPNKGWGKQYGGVKSPDACNQLPANLQEGCKWRWTWAGGNINMKKVNYVQVECPQELTGISGCTN
ncbi:glycoside hydrolase [Phyllosticta citriasiana]|uniref:cellulase n=1 Tax=Phyllosticta citriasiana TaxID=595635 RepID=A0ABR1KMZ0_9PEZI